MTVASCSDKPNSLALSVTVAPELLRIATSALWATSKDAIPRRYADKRPPRRRLQGLRLTVGGSEDAAVALFRLIDADEILIHVRREQTAQRHVLAEQDHCRLSSRLCARSASKLVNSLRVWGDDS